MNDEQLRYAWVAVSASLVIVAMWTGWFGVLWTAMFGTFLSVGLKTGSLAPHFPTVTRTEKPRIFWVSMVFCALMFGANVLHLVHML